MLLDLNGCKKPNLTVYDLVNLFITYNRYQVIVSFYCPKKVKSHLLSSQIISWINPIYHFYLSPFDSLVAKFEFMLPVKLTSSGFDAAVRESKQVKSPDTVTRVRMSRGKVASISSN